MTAALANTGSVQAIIFFDIRSIDKQGGLGKVLQQLDAASSETTRPLGRVHGPAAFDASQAARSAYYHWTTFADAATANAFATQSLAVLKQAGLPAVAVISDPGQSLPGRTIRGTFQWIAQQRKAAALIP